MPQSIQSPTVAEFAERYLREYAGPPYHPAKNRKHAASVLRLYLLPALAELRLAEVTPKHMQGLQRALFARGLAYYTVQGAIQSVWGSLWKAAKTEGLVIGKPHAELTWPRHTPEADPFTADEREAIVRWFERKKPKYAPLVGCIFLAGMRPSEACGLRRGDVDLEDGWITIRQAIASRETTKGKTPKSPRRIKVATELVELLRRTVPPWLGAHELLHRNSRGNPVNSQWFGSFHFKHCCDELGLRYRGVYAGRHTFVTLTLMAGGDPVELTAFVANTLQTMWRYYWRWMGGVADPAETARKRSIARAERSVSPGADEHRARL